MNFSAIAKQKLREKNMKPSTLARQMNYSPQYVLDLLAGHRRWNETTMSRACEALGIRVMFIDAEIKGESGERGEKAKPGNPEDAPPVNTPPEKEKSCCARAGEQN